MVQSMIQAILAAFVGMCFFSVIIWALVIALYTTRQRRQWQSEARAFALQRRLETHVSRPMQRISPQLAFCEWGKHSIAPELVSWNMPSACIFHAKMAEDVLSAASVTSKEQDR